MTQTIPTTEQYGLWVIQALLGAISNNFRFVSVEVAAGGVVIKIVLAKDDEDDRASIEDFATEFEALLPVRVPYKVEVVVSKETIVWPPHTSLVVFKRRE
jgi:hypothetical protein